MFLKGSGRSPPPGATNRRAHLPASLFPALAPTVYSSPLAGPCSALTAAGVLCAAAVMLAVGGTPGQPRGRYDDLTAGEEHPCPRALPMNHTRLLAQIKLRETERQRDRLQKQYDAIEARVAQAGSPLERLRALHQGLRGVTFAQKPLHPDVRELDALSLADQLGTVPPELVADRTRFLERELAQGRLRGEFTYA